MFERFDSEWAGYMWMAGVLLVLPTVIGRFMGAPWREIGFAFGIILILACLFGLASAKTWEMRATWAAIGFIIAVVPGVPLVLFILRWAR